jgi:hypothetical protein
MLARCVQAVTTPIIAGRTPEQRLQEAQITSVLALASSLPMRGKGLRQHDGSTLATNLGGHS